MLESVLPMVLEGRISQKQERLSERKDYIMDKLVVPVEEKDKLESLSRLRQNGPQETAYISLDLKIYSFIECAVLNNSLYE